MSTRAIKRKGAKVSVAEGEAPAEETAVVETTTVKNNSSSKNRSKRTKTATVDEAVVAEGVVVEAVAASAVAEEAVVAEADIAEDVAAEDNIKEKAGAVAAAEVVATTTTNITIKPSKPPRTANARFPAHLKPTDPSHFDHFLFQLLAVRAETNNANFNVHKDEYPVLYSWLQFIKKEYKNFSNTATTSQLTPQQIAVLESLHVPLTSRGDDHWNRFYEQLVAYKARHGHALVPRLCEVPGLGDWVTDQRRQYKAKQQGQATQLSDLRQEKLEALDFVWHVRNRPEWEVRYAELLAYKNLHGDCKVPQHFKPNKALGKWVAKQREQYKLMLKGQHSFLTPYRQEKLNNAGFAWQVRTGLENEVRTVMADAAVTTAPVEDAVVVLAVEAVPELGAQQLEVVDAVDAVDADIHETIMEEETKQHEHEAEV